MISEVASRRSKFTAILKNDGIDGLVVAFNRKADLLTGTTAKSFQDWHYEATHPRVLDSCAKEDLT